MFSDVSDRMPRKVRIGDRLLAAVRQLCCGMSHDLVLSSIHSDILTTTLEVFLHESQSLGQGAYRGFALVRGQSAQQLAQMRVIFLHIDAADIQAAFGERERHRTPIGGIGVVTPRNALTSPTRAVPVSCPFGSLICQTASITWT